MDPKNKYATWVEINLNSIENNIHYFMEKLGMSVMAIVKANAYGHGIIQVGRTAEQSGASWLGVARTNEALKLRTAGIKCPILILGMIPAGSMEEIIRAGVAITIWHVDQIELADKAASKVGEPAQLHLKIDTGTSRLGANPFQAERIIRQALKKKMVKLEGIFTHFARADEKKPRVTDFQVSKFCRLVERFESLAIRPPIVHCANSAAALSLPNIKFSLIRVGIAIYGLHPSHQCILPQCFNPALSWKSVISHIKLLKPGMGVSYGHDYITSKCERIGTIPVGYGDGFRRVVGNEVLVRGQRVPVVGRVTMDQIMVQLDKLPEAQIMDEVVIIGTQNKNHIRAEDIARRWGTINYEVTTGISSRVQRLYFMLDSTAKCNNG